MKNPTESRLHMRSVLTATASALVTCFAFANPAWAQSNSIESITTFNSRVITLCQVIELLIRRANPTAALLW